MSTTLKNAPQFKHFKVVPRTPTIGGTIEGIHLSEVSNEEVAEELRQALWHYGVLFAPKQHLSSEQMKQVAYCFGEKLEKHTFGKAGGAGDEHDPEVLLIEMQYGKQAKITTDLWHHDVDGRTQPNCMSILQAETVPFGADTMWSSAVAAYENLPYPLKMMFLNLDIDHDTAFAVLRHGFLNGSEIAKKMLELGEFHTCPAVIEHYATGKRCLFLGSGGVKRVHKFPTDLSDHILKLGQELPKVPEYQVRHQWQPGDVALWDNFLTWHYGVTSGVEGDVRRLHRVSALSSKVELKLDRERAIRELMQSGT